MGLCDTPILGAACHPIQTITGGVATSVFDAIVKEFMGSLGNALKAIVTLWTALPAPDVGEQSPVVHQLMTSTRPLIAFVALLGLITGACRLVWSAHHQQSVRDILRGLLLLVVVTGGAGTVVELLVTGCDALARSVVNTGFNGAGVSASLHNFEALGNASGNGLGSAGLFLLAILGLVASFLQMMIMLVRGAILAVLVGVLPIAAAASITGVGLAWFKRLLGWIVSFCVYMLCAAIFYAAAFALMADTQDTLGVVGGFGLIITAVLVLPALLRLLPPSAEAMGGMGGGAMLGAAAAAATGAMALSGRGSGSSAPQATATPGLKSPPGTIDSGNKGTEGQGGGSGAVPVLPPGGGGGGAGAGAAKAVPVAAIAQAGMQAVSAAKGAADGAAGGGS